jgi:predicted RNA-binding Zn-ribbon protein involved in translation (DUF1610 family)
MGDFFRNLSSKMESAMIGRNGTDKLGAISLVISIVLLVIYNFLPSLILMILVWAFLIYSVFRTWSKNVQARRAEQAKFDELWDKVFHRGGSSSGAGRSSHRQAGSGTTRTTRPSRNSKASTNKVIFSCDNCGQSLSVPKGRGTLKVTCPKCGRTTVIKS